MLSRSTLSGNVSNFANTAASGGGAIANRAGARLEVRTSTLSVNDSRPWFKFPDVVSMPGAAVLNGLDSQDTGHVLLVDSTIAGNDGLSDLGAEAVNGQFRLQNTLINGKCSGAFFDLGGNLQSSNSCGLPAGASNQALMLSALQDNGGATLTHLPLAGSPAIDRVACGTTSVDQRGVQRPQGASCDAGAVEVRSASAVLTVSVSGSGSVSGLPLPGGAGSSGGITACSAGGGACSATYMGEQTNATVTLTATAPAGTVVGWSGACTPSAIDPMQATVAMAGARNCHATLTAASHAITTLVDGASPAGSGSWSCAATSVVQGGATQCTATPANGFALAALSGCDSSTGTVCQLSNVTQARTVTARFVAKAFEGTTRPAAGAGALASAQFTGGGPTCRFDETQTDFVPAPATQPLGQTLPHGLFAFTLVGCDTTAEAVTMTTIWPTPVEGYVKHGLSSSSATDRDYFAPPALSINGHSASFVLHDGQLGDDDWQANGVIRDPTGPTATAGGGGQAPVAVPSLSGAMLVVLAALAGLLGAPALRRRPGLC